MTLQDQSWVLVTGASSGFGEEFARQYAAQGRPLVLVARRLEKLQTLATKLRERYRVDIIIEQVDLSNVAAVIQLHQRPPSDRVGADARMSDDSHTCPVRTTPSAQSASVSQVPRRAHRLRQETAHRSRWHHQR